MNKRFIAVTIFAALLSVPVWAAEDAETEAVEYGYKQDSFQSKPKVGGYIIGSYKYSDKDGANGGDGFGCRLIRLYVDGSIFNDFKYRIQFQANGTSPHVKDFYVEWAKYREFSVKMGQFKRAFTFENPMNPWDVGVGDFSFLVQKFAGMGDRLGESNMGGRDIGVQVQGDLLPVSDDKHSLFHYQLGLYNGQGINAKDVNQQKDVIGTIQVQPIKGLYLGVFGWKGTWNNGVEDLNRERVSAGVKYDSNNWTFRAEYATAVGDEKEDTGVANAVYVTLGVPVQPWLKVYVKWDEYNDDKTGATVTQDMYSASANFRLHKNLNFQLEYRRHQDYLHISDTHSGYNEIWFMTYIRF